MTEREAYITLNMLPGIGAARSEALINAFGSAAAIFSQSADALSRVPKIPSALAAKIADWRNHTDLAAELNLTERSGVQIITLADADYPDVLKEIFDPPLCLYVRGTLPQFDLRTVAVVGSRRMTKYGRMMARRLTEDAVYAGWKVISGLAYGVDAVAHQAALDANGITVAVLGGGLARIHPQDHIPLARSIVEHSGAVISEFPMNYPVSRQSFPRRNRIVSGLSRAVLVVEADIDSGAMITAGIALEQGRQVFAVPGQADNPQARGCHKLIREGACLLENFGDVLREFEFQPELGYDDNVSTMQQHDLFDGLDGDEQQVVNLLREESKNFDDLVAALEFNTGELLAIMMRLEVKMVVKQELGRVYRLL
ncbi:MAG: DNA-processing protein DprA [Victivallaceae bacterium]